MVAVPLALAALAALALVAVGIGGGGSGGPALNATPVEPAVPAPAIRGTDQDGRAVALPREGRPMVVTFMFTRCPTTCPLISRQLASALDMLGPDAEGVDVVAISVDPEGDTPVRARAFIRSHGLQGRLRYVVGSRAELAPHWAAWQVAAQPSDQPSLSVHSARIVLVDRSGRQVGRYAAGLPIPPSDIAEDVDALLG
jgi:protein SCO1/2